MDDQLITLHQAAKELEKRYSTLVTWSNAKSMARKGVTPLEVIRIPPTPKGTLYTTRAAIRRFGKVIGGEAAVSESAREAKRILELEFGQEEMR